MHNLIHTPTAGCATSIQTHKFTVGIPEEISVFSARHGKNILDVDLRQVLPDDKSSMMLRDWKQDKDGLWKGRMGGSTNTIFSQDGTQNIWDNSPNPQLKQHDEKGKSHKGW